MAPGEYEGSRKYGDLLSMLNSLGVSFLVLALSGREA